MRLHLVIGNKNYSSWSMRPWFAMKAVGIPFDETVVPLYGEGSKENILSFSPAGKVPVLVDGETTVWESLSILEYLAEIFPEKSLWPKDAGARALARNISAEMHAGFVPLRKECCMNLHRPPKPVPLSDDAKANIARIEAMWAACRAQFGRGGPFLFGQFSAADAMYAPVVSRFHTYAVEVGAAARAYMAAVMALPAWQEWERGALAEPWRLEAFEL